MFVQFGGDKLVGYIKKVIGSSTFFYDIEIFNGNLTFEKVVINEKVDWVQVYDANKHG
jgi:hypothetical protein